MNGKIIYMGVEKVYHLCEKVKSLKGFM
jgi:hypothetical protein